MKGYRRWPAVSQKLAGRQAFCDYHLAWLSLCLSSVSRSKMCPLLLQMWPMSSGSMTFSRALPLPTEVAAVEENITGQLHDLQERDMWLRKSRDMYQIRPNWFKGQCVGGCILLRVLPAVKFLRLDSLASLSCLSRSAALALNREARTLLWGTPKWPLAWCSLAVLQRNWHGQRNPCWLNFATQCPRPII